MNYLCLLVHADCLPETYSYDSTYERAYDEYPYLFQCVAAFEESRAKRTSRVHRCAGVVNTNEVDENQ